LDIINSDISVLNQSAGLAVIPFKFEKPKCDTALYNKVPNLSIRCLSSKSDCIDSSIILNRGSDLPYIDIEQKRILKGKEREAAVKGYDPKLLNNLSDADVVEESTCKINLDPNYLMKKPNLDWRSCYLSPNNCRPGLRCLPIPEIDRLDYCGFVNDPCQEILVKVPKLESFAAGLGKLKADIETCCNEPTCNNFIDQYPKYDSLGAQKTIHVYDDGAR
jgi:hypothetical protein